MYRCSIGESNRIVTTNLQPTIILPNLPIIRTEHPHNSHRLCEVGLSRPRERVLVAGGLLCWVCWSSPPSPVPFNLIVGWCLLGCECCCVSIMIQGSNPYREALSSRLPPPVALLQSARASLYAHPCWWWDGRLTAPQPLRPLLPLVPSELAKLAPNGSLERHGYVLPSHIQVPGRCPI